MDKFDLLFGFLEMKKELKEEQRKSAMSRIQSQALTIVLEKRRRRIDQLGALSSKICETIQREREEKRKLQLQYCPETLEAEDYVPEDEDSDERESRELTKLFEDDKKEGGVKLYVQNTEYKKIVLNVKDLTDICEVTTDGEAENELTSLDSDETKKKKRKTKKLLKKQSKPEPPVPTVASEHSIRKKKKKKKHNDSLSDDEPPLLVPAPELQRITLTEADIDTLTEEFDEAHALKLRQALEDLMRAQGVVCGDTSKGDEAPDDEDKSAVTDVVDDDSGWVTFTDSFEVSRGPPSGFGFITDDGRQAAGASSASSNPTTTVGSETQAGSNKKKKNKKKISFDTSFDVNDVD